MRWITLKKFNDCANVEMFCFWTKERNRIILYGGCFLENFLNITCSLTLTFILHFRGLFSPLNIKTTCTQPKLT